jgi:hypothetical protein
MCVLCALLAFACGWLVPAHLRATETPVLKRAGRNTASLTSRGFELLRGGQLGAAELMSRAAQDAKLASANELASAVESNAKQFPVVEAWGAAEPELNNYFPSAPTAGGSNELSFTDFVVREENRSKALETLKTSKQSVVQELLQSRALTNTTTFAPSQAPGGEAFDTAVAITGLLLEDRKLTSSLGNEIYLTASQANRGGNTESLEQVLLDFLSLGQRLNWGQLAAFCGNISDAGTLHEQAELVRGTGGQLPELFAAVDLSGDAKAVSQYVKTFHESGLKDLTAALPFGSGAVHLLLQNNQRIYTSPLREWSSSTEPFSGITYLAADYCWQTPRLALILKWILYLVAGFLLAMAWRIGSPAVSRLEMPLQVRGFRAAREILFAMGFLLVVALVSEPFLAPEGPTAALPFRLRIPTVGGAIQPGSPNTKLFMNNSNWMPMLLFFVLQALLYVACLVKLAEIRRQRVSPRVKLKLLENEEHLFDGGLYLGFLGTIISFIVYQLVHGTQFSLMVAYSSTSFGILFVSFFKIFQLRPTRRKLLLEAEAETPTVATLSAAPSLAS